MSKHAGPKRNPRFDGGYILFAGSGSIVSNSVGGSSVAVTVDSIIQCDIADLHLVQG